MNSDLELGDLLDQLYDDFGLNKPFFSEFIFPGPVQPIRVENYIPFYNSDQIERYGLPEYWGVEQYQIIETRESGAPMVTDYDMEQARVGALRPIHYYNRVERFESTLYQLVACRGKVPPDVVEYIVNSGFDRHPDRVWDSIRTILKQKKDKKWTRYYNRIPTILQILGFERKINFGDQNSFILELVNDFKKVQAAFERIKPTLSRTYFPNLRYVAFRLLQQHGAMFEYRIPFLRTPSKEKMLDELWNLIQENI